MISAALRGMLGGVRQHPDPQFLAMADPEILKTGEGRKTMYQPVVIYRKYTQRTYYTGKDGVLKKI